jgi:hypothetical protein
MFAPEYLLGPDVPLTPATAKEQVIRNISEQTVVKNFIETTLPS